MTYRIEALPLAPFAPYFAMSDKDLAAVGARRWVADAPGRAPCRVSLRDADAGEALVLVNHAHLTDPTSPYRASGPIFVRESAVEQAPITCLAATAPTFSASCPRRTAPSTRRISSPIFSMRATGSTCPPSTPA